MSACQLVCITAQITYIYSGVEHQKSDWLGVHEKICEYLVPLRTAVPFLTSEEERENRKQWLLQKRVIHKLSDCQAVYWEQIEKKLLFLR